MIYLATNTANQECIFTLKEASQFYNVAWSHYLCVLKNANTNTEYFQVLEVVTENDRYTKVKINTWSITDAGTYYYTIYGQNSDTNIDITDESIVGILEVGVLTLESGNGFFDEPTITIPQAIIYNPDGE